MAENDAMSPVRRLASEKSPAESKEWSLKSIEVEDFEHNLPVKIAEIKPKQSDKSLNQNKNANLDNEESKGRSSSSESGSRSPSNKGDDIGTSNEPLNDNHQEGRQEA